MKRTNLKKFLLLFCMLACVFSMTACGNPQINNQAAKDSLKEAKVEECKTFIIAWAYDMINYLDSTPAETIIADAEAGKGLDLVTGNKYIVNQLGINVKTIELYNSWNSTRGELGRVTNLSEITENSFDVQVSDETGILCTVAVTLKFENRECTFEFVINDDDMYYLTLQSGAINPSYSTGEKMAKAGMNTLIGMGTVFVVLIFISFIISLFKYVNAFQNRDKNKKEDTSAAGVDNAIAQIVSNEEQEEDDLELIAVIAAAIAAAEGTSPDGLVVRSIRKVNSRRK